MSAIRFSHVSFSYSSAVSIIENATFNLGSGWTGLVGANGAGKSTLLSLVAGIHDPDDGRIDIEPAAPAPVLCAQRVHESSPEIERFATDWRSDAARMRDRLNLHADDIERWRTLSPGERKRWQVGAALVESPAILLLDEPTNHLDEGARDLLIATLRGYRGAGIVVSHDRVLLNTLTQRTIRVHRGHVDLWTGSYDTARHGWEAERASLIENHDARVGEHKKLERRISDKRRTSAHKDAKRIRERRTADKNDLDTRGAAATAKHERGQRTGARTVASMTKSRDRMADEIADIDITRERGGTISFPSAPANKEFLARHLGVIDAGPRTLFEVDVAIRRTDRIRIAGRNGIGKTTIMNTLVERSAIAPRRILHLPQESNPEDEAEWLAGIRSLDSADMGRVMSLVALLGADPAALLSSDHPSPGEARKLAIALGLGTPTWLLALDEPTNHLDLPSIERLEEALDGYVGAILLITHDDALAGACTTTTWGVHPAGITIV
ncbi:MAG: ATP-binding cassette domain-containing protein [Actinomycetia bacterium]|nr:ATP-binding cassette domain-containing protein [Actinomycetes bacterium]